MAMREVILFFIEKTKDRQRGLPSVERSRRFSKFITYTIMNTMELCVIGIVYV